MNYENMSDFELTMRVASEVAEDSWISANKSARSDSELVLTYQNGPGCTRNVYIDYCNNPSDAWPIIMESHITIFSPDYNKGDSDWRAEIYDSDEGIFDFTDRNPLRAAMIVFLMMQEAKRG